MCRSCQIKDGLRKSFEENNNKGTGTFVAENILIRPKSRGTIRLQSNDPFDPPLIDPNYLHHPDDLKVLLEGIIFSLILFLSVFWQIQLLFEVDTCILLICKILCKHQLINHYRLLLLIVKILPLLVIDWCRFLSKAFVFKLLLSDSVILFDTGYMCQISAFDVIHPLSYLRLVS